MKIKLKLSILICLILLSSFVSAGISNYSTSRTKYYYNGTYYFADSIETTGSTALNGATPSDGDNIVTVGGWSYGINSQYNTTKSYTGSMSIKGISMDTGSEFIRLDINNLSFTGTIVYQLWQNCSSWCNWGSNLVGSNSIGMRTESLESNNFQYLDYVPSWNDCNLNTIPIVNSNWFEVMYAFNGTNNVSGYINGVKCTNWTGVGGVNYITFASEGRGATVWVDSIRVCNGNCNFTNTAPTISLTSPADNDHNRVNLTVDYTPNDADSDTLSCFLFINNTLNMTDTSITLGSSNTFTTTQLFNDGDYGWYINCSDGVINTTTTQRTYTLDTTNPILSIFSPINMTYFNSNFWINFSATDTNLYIINYTFYNSTTIIQSNQSLTTTLSYLDLNDTINVANLGNGTYYINFSASDQHTKKKIPPMDVKKGINYLMYDNSIKITAEDAVSSETTKYDDRYDFKFIYLEAKSTRVFYLESDSTLYYLDNSEYTAHFIDWKNKKWIDFEGLDDKPKVVKITDTMYMIEFNNIKSDILIFNSIGGLNIVEKYYEVYIDKLPPSFSNNRTNASSTTPRYNEVVQINLTLTDSDLDFYVLSHNDTGTMTNTTFRDISGSAHTVIENITISNLKRGGILGWQVWANDSLNQINVSPIYTLEIQNIAPNQPSITSPYDNEINNTRKIEFNSTDIDGDNIIYMLYINNTLNITTPTNITIWNASDGYYNLTITANDSFGFSANSTAIHFRLDTTSPSWDNNKTNASLMRISGNATFNITISDNGGLSSYIFSWNGTGVWDNSTNGAISGSSTNLVINKSTNLTRGNTIGYLWYANDSLNQWNNSGVRTFIVANTIPTTPILISPTGLSSTLNNYSILKYNSTDSDNLTDTITFWVYGDTNINPITLIFNGTSYGNSTYNWSNLNDGSYYWKVKAGDSYDNSSNSSVYKFTVSTTSPATTLKYPTNNLWFNTRNITSFNFTTQDENGILSCNLWHNLSGNWKWNQSNTSIIINDGTTHYAFAGANNTIDERMYIWNVNCSDVNDNYGFYTSNFTFYVDSVQPSITLTQPTGTKTSRTNIPITFSITDFSSLSNCRYNITAIGLSPITNSSFNCNENTTFSVSVDASYTFTLYVNDTAGNIGSSSLSFTVDTSTPSAPTGGGGGSSPPSTQCTKTEDCKEFGDKYVCIQNYCIFQEFLPVCNYNSICEPLLGENFGNCGNEYVNKTLILEGDCDPIVLRNWAKMGLASNYFLWTLLILSILITIGLTQTKETSFTKRTYKTYYPRFRKYFRRKKRKV